MKLDDHPSECRLATARLSDQAERLARLDREVHIVDGVDYGAPERSSSRKVLDHVFDANQRLLGGRIRYRCDRLLGVHFKASASGFGTFFISTQHREIGRASC